MYRLSFRTTKLSENSTRETSISYRTLKENANLRY